MPVSKYTLQMYAMSMVGLPYRWGGDDPVEGFDCSGLVLELLKSVGVMPGSVDMTAAGLADYFKARKVAPKFGALSFYGTGKITHVGFCLDEKLMLEAGGGTSKTLTKDDASKQNAYVRIRPIMSRGDLVDILMPKYPWEG